MIKESFTVRKIRQQKEYQSKPHFHDFNEIFIIAKGEACMVIDTKEYHAASGSVIFISGGTLHCKLNSDAGELNAFILHYPSRLLSEISTPKTNLYELLAGYNGCLSLSKKELLALIKKISELSFSEEESAFGNDLLNLGIFADLLVHAARFASAAQPVKAESFDHRYRDDQNIAQIINYIDSHLTEDISLDKLAENFYLNKFSICHSFKNKTGLTVNNYINMRRVQLASQYLKQGLSVREAAEKTGYHSLAHFIRTFKSLAGTTPKQFACTYRKSKSKT